jgi:hypothetical protein
MAGFLIEGSARQLQTVGAAQVSNCRSARSVLPGVAGADGRGRRDGDLPRGTGKQAGSQSGRLRNFMRLRRDTPRTNPDLYDPLASFLGVSMGELGRLMLQSDVEGLRPARVNTHR